MNRQLCRIVSVFSVVIVMSQSSLSQEKSISITIDDVPNTAKYQQDGYRSVLLEVLDSLEVPFTVFVNEDKVYKTDSVDLNKALLLSWMKREQAIVGNHTYSHLRYSEVGFDRFVEDIEKGEVLSQELAATCGKRLTYFRFPFNDLGKDSLQQVQIRNFLKSKGYQIAPFTVESSDWMFDVVYRYYLKNDQPEKAKEIGREYVEKTMELLAFYEEMAQTRYGRSVKHIYLYHDNAINADYLAEIINRLKQEKYVIVSFDESLTDPVYSQEDRYYKKWGISWLYRWMDTQQERMEWMKKEPDLSEINKRYEECMK